MLQQFVDSCEKRYDYVNKVAASFGAKFLLIWQPCWWAETEPVAAAVRAQEGIIMSKKSALRDNFVVTYQALVERLKDKPYFINLQNCLLPGLSLCISPTASTCWTSAVKSWPSISTRS